MTNWRILITDELTLNNETWEDVVHCTPLDADKEFTDSLSEPFTLWTHNRVYFPVAYDKYQWVKSVPRDPCGLATKHIGN